jgi:hypothetical protein
MCGEFLLAERNALENHQELNIVIGFPAIPASILPAAAGARRRVNRAIAEMRIISSQPANRRFKGSYPGSHHQ